MTDTTETVQRQAEYSPRIREVVNALMDYALVLAIIYNSNSLWALAGDNFSLSCFVLLAVCMAYMLCCWREARHRLHRVGSAMLVLVLATVIGQLVMAVSHGGSGYTNGTWFQYALIVPALMGCMLMRGHEYVRKVLLNRLVVVAAVFAAISVVLWAASSFLLLPPSHVERLSWVHNVPPI